MNTLIITYNLQDINVFEYDPVLYLVESITPIVKRKLTGKHVSLIKKENIYDNLIDQVRKYYKHFDVIILLDNSSLYKIDNISININTDWIITGNTHASQWKKNNLVPEFYDINKLAFNCSFLNNSIFELLVPVHVRNIYFPYFSRVKYVYYDLTFDKVCQGIEKEPKSYKRDNILL